MNPAENPSASGPWDTWIRQTYGDALPADAMLRYLTNANAASEQASGPRTLATAAHDVVTTFAQGKGNLSDFALAPGTVKRLVDLSGQVKSGNESGLSPEQVALVKYINAAADRGRTMSALMLGAYQSRYGGEGLASYSQELQGASSAYYYNPSRYLGADGRPLPFAKYLYMAMHGAFVSRTTR